MVDEMTDDDAEEIIRQFAEITETDEAFAHFMLQDDNFDLERALTRYFSSEDPETLYKTFRTDNGVHSDSGGQSPLQQDRFDKMSAMSSETVETNNKQPPKKRARAEVDKHVFPAELTLLSWNVDGQDSRSLDKRFLAVLYIIAKTNPEVIFLQEMIPSLMPRLNELLQAMYTVVAADLSAPYFCVTLISKNITVTATEVLPFPNTQMDRSMTVIQAKWQKLHLALINTHLESMRESANTRMAQFKQCMDKLKELTALNPIETLAIFGGDLNIRDKEVRSLKETGGFPPNMRDVWEADGADMSKRFTWDMLRNDNYPKNGNARCRFDRVYFCGPYEAVEFKLDGVNRIRGPECFASDHFALICRFVSPRNSSDSKGSLSTSGASSSSIAPSMEE